jgi:hypothetical protein
MALELLARNVHACSEGRLDEQVQMPGGRHTHEAASASPALIVPAGEVYRERGAASMSITDSQSVSLDLLAMYAEDM